jgi:hypothetical protein
VKPKLLLCQVLLFKKGTVGIVSNRKHLTHEAAIDQVVKQGLHYLMH